MAANVTSASAALMREVVNVLETSGGK